MDMKSSELSSYSSTESKVTVNKSFMEKSADLEHLQVTTKEVHQVHRRRSNIILGQLMDPDLQEETKKSRRHSKKISKPKLRNDLTARKSLKKKVRLSIYCDLERQSS